MRGHALEAATVFTDPALLGASNARLEGKMIRGGMGDGMPAWGTVFSDEELQALLDYLWTFQFPQKEGWTAGITSGAARCFLPRRSTRRRKHTRRT